MTHAAIPVLTTAAYNGTNSPISCVRYDICTLPTAYSVSSANVDIDACHCRSRFGRDQRKGYDRSNQKDLEHLVFSRRNVNASPDDRREIRALCGEPRPSGRATRSNLPI